MNSTPSLPDRPDPTVTITNKSGTVTLTIQGKFWPGCGPRSWSMPDQAMQALITGCLRSHDTLLADLFHWHTHALACSGNLVRGDFGDALGNVLTAASAHELAEKEEEARDA